MKSERESLNAARAFESTDPIAFGVLNTHRKALESLVNLHVMASCKVAGVGLVYVRDEAHLRREFRRRFSDEFSQIVK